MKLLRSKSSLCFSLLFLAACTGAQEDSKPAYSSGEHLILGDKGFVAACGANPTICANKLMRLDGKKSFSYGELVAFSGDFYGTPEEIFQEKDQPFLQWKRNDVEGVRGNFVKEVETIENFLHGHSDGEYPDFNVSSAWNYPDYLNLSLANAPHFGFYNMLTYVKYHGLALTQARSAFELKASQPAEAEKLLVKALFTNAFADHFLTDGFASGHIRDPRVQILDWSKTQNISDRAAGTLAKIVHDRDGEVRASGEHGLNVTNARGDEWMTRCDSQLFWNNTMEDQSITQPIAAVQASVREVMTAYEKGVMASGVYAAAQFVPYPSLNERKLVELFPADMPEAEYDKLIAQMAFYTQIKAFSGVDKVVLKKFTAELPKLMSNFQNAVRTEVRNNPELSQRLPQAYLNAYSNIQ